MEYKVGDRVVVTVDLPDVTAGRDYRVEEVGMDRVMVIDDGGDDNWIWAENVKPYDGGQYTRILEEVAGPDAVAMAKRIMEVLK